MYLLFFLVGTIIWSIGAAVFHNARDDQGWNEAVGFVTFAIGGSVTMIGLLGMLP